MAVQWNSQFSVGIVAIDEDHWKLFMMSDVVLSRHLVHHSAFAGRAKPGDKLRLHTITAAWLIPALRQISETRTSSAPCFKMNAFCASVNFDGIFLSQPGNPIRKL